MIRRWVFVALSYPIFLLRKQTNMGSSSWYLLEKKSSSIKILFLLHFEVFWKKFQISLLHIWNSTASHSEERDEYDWIVKNKHIAIELCCNEIRDQMRYVASIYWARKFKVSIRVIIFNVHFCFASIYNLKSWNDSRTAPDIFVVSSDLQKRSLYP